jgi:hypothetical protein
LLTLLSASPYNHNPLISAVRGRFAHCRMLNFL